MPKQLINKEKWTQNDVRFMVVLLLTVVYPIFATSFFTVVFFAIIPTLKSVQAAPHIYWLIVTFIWGLLCALILPCFREAEVSKQSIGIDFEQGPAYPTKVHAVQPFVKIEEGDNKQRLSLLTNESKESNESIEKAEKESLEKSKEDLGKSSASLDKEKITQSGEFLNECIDSLGPEKLQEEEAECEVHAEQENKDNDQNKEDNITNVQDDAKEKDKDNEDVLQTDENKDKITQDDKENEKVEDEPSEAVEPIIEQNEKIQTEAEPLQVGKGTILESEIPEEEEMTELEEDKDPVMRRKALPTIDTSRSSGYYECSMPTPKSSGSGRPQSNMVFLFVNPDIASTEEDIIVNQQGDVQEKEKEN